MNDSYDVIIVGGGIIGLSAAIAMQQRGFSVAVIDANDFSKTISSARVYALNSLSQKLLQDLKVWQLVDPSKVCFYDRMSVLDAQSKTAINFDAREIAENNLGVIVEETIIKNALLQTINQLPIKLFPNNIVKSIETNKNNSIIKSTNSIWQAKLIIVSDGPLSNCRQLLNIPITTWPYHQQAIVCNVSTAQPHKNTAYQVFTNDGPLAFLPLASNISAQAGTQNSCSIVWSTSEKNAKDLMKLPNDAFAETLRGEFSQLGGIELKSKRQQFPLVMRHIKNYSGDNWLIMGDAAHTIHPLAGLGLNLGFADLNTWLCYLDKEKNWSNKTLQAYQRARKNEVWQIIMLMESLKMIYANPILNFPRRIGLNFCNKFLPIKRWLIQEARGRVNL